MSIPSMADQVNVVGDNLTILLIVVSSAAFLVTMYNLIALLLCGRHASNQDLEQTSPRLVTGTVLSTPSTAESSVAHLIPAYKYQKKMDVADEDGICAVCLGNFEDGEDLKILPECLHSFHVPCIDMWLYSHSNCPICRTDATPLLEIPSHVPDFNSDESNRRQNLELQNVVLQSSIV